MDNELEKMLYTAATYRNTNMAEIARSVGMTPQNLYQKMKRRTLRPEVISKIGKAMGAEYVFYLAFPNGTKIGKLEKYKTKKIKTA